VAIRYSYENCGNNLPLDEEKVLAVLSSACILTNLKRDCPLKERWIKTYTEFPHLLPEHLLDCILYSKVSD
jgi:hypothetical protein